MNSMERTINDKFFDYKKIYKLMNDIPNNFKFSSNKNISGKKSKPIPITSENVCKGKKIQEVHSAGL